MTFVVMWGQSWQNSRAFRSGRKARAFLQALDEQGEEGGLYICRPGQSMIDWTPLGFTQIFNRRYR